MSGGREFTSHSQRLAVPVAGTPQLIERRISGQDRGRDGVLASTAAVTLYSERRGTSHQPKVVHDFGADAHMKAQSVLAVWPSYGITASQPSEPVELRCSLGHGYRGQRPRVPSGFCAPVGCPNAWAAWTSSGSPGVVVAGSGADVQPCATTR